MELWVQMFICTFLNINYCRPLKADFTIIILYFVQIMENGLNRNFKVLRILNIIYLCRKFSTNSFWKHIFYEYETILYKKIYEMKYFNTSHYYDCYVGRSLHRYLLDIYIHIYYLKINELNQSSQAGVYFFQLNSC